MGSVPHERRYGCRSDRTDRGCRHRVGRVFHRGVRAGAGFKVTALTVVLWAFVLTALAGIYVAAWGLIRSMPVALEPL
jgi:hypothetical protein